MNTLIRMGMVSALALATALPAAAQPTYRETPESVADREAYEAQRRNYEGQRDQYEGRRDQYEARRDQYENSSQTYEREARDTREARRDYNYRLAEWNRARRIYDRRYGYGAYSRMYARPVWNQDYWTRHEPPRYAGYYGGDASAINMRCGSNGTVAGGLIGALAGAVLGSNVAARNARTEGTVLGGVVGAAVGAGVGRANDKYRCDRRGPYFSYDETMPYREGRNRFSSSYDPGYYESQRCRLAAAPIDSYGREQRYVRVCPDAEGRFRITG